MQETLEQTKKHLKSSYEIYKLYKSIIDSYVLDFYTENNWAKLPLSWQRDLEDIDPKELAKILNYKEPLLVKSVFPLSFLCLREAVKLLDIERQQIPLEKVVNFDDKIQKLLWKHVKNKKRHEITTMAELSFKKAQECGCDFVIDIGSGVGHLSRVMAYGYGVKMCGIEAQEGLTETAKSQDAQFESFLKKYPQYNVSFEKVRPTHANMRIEPNLTPEKFVEIIVDSLKLESNNFKMGIIALHACGDLSATLLRLYNKCPNMKFLNIVGCCYMKLSTDGNDSGFPLSDFSRQGKYNLTYNSREVACHYIENYIDRLNQGNFWELRIHSYRAALEKILSKHWPHYCQSPLSSVKYTKDLEFYDYCLKALKKLDLFIDKAITDSEDIRKNLEDWRKVVIFYSVRLLIAPVVESIILLDRYLYVLENFREAQLIPAFDPKLSPRNHILSSKRL